MEDALVITPTGESDNVGTSPDTLKANSTIEVLAWLKEHRTVGCLAHKPGDPGELASVACPSTNEGKDREHYDEVAGHCDHEHVKNYSESVTDTIG